MAVRADTRDGRPPSVLEETITVQKGAVFCEKLVLPAVGLV